MIKSGIMRIMRYAGHVACMWGMGNAYRIVVGKPEGKKPQQRPRRKWRILLKCILGENV
jgi:hypothetical protein